MNFQPTPPKVETKKVSRRNLWLAILVVLAVVVLVVLTRAIPASVRSSAPVATSAPVAKSTSAPVVSQQPAAEKKEAGVVAQATPVLTGNADNDTGWRGYLVGSGSADIVFNQRTNPDPSTPMIVRNTSAADGYFTFDGDPAAIVAKDPSGKVVFKLADGKIGPENGVSVYGILPPGWSLEARTTYYAKGDPGNKNLWYEVYALRPGASADELLALMKKKSDAKSKAWKFVFSADKGFEKIN